MAAEGTASGYLQISLNKGELDKETNRILASVDGLIKLKPEVPAGGKSYGILLSYYRAKLVVINQLMVDFATLLVKDTVDVQASAEAIVEADIEAEKVWKATV